MATMNQPAVGANNWYQAVTDNWTSIEQNLLDLATFTAKGDMFAASAAATAMRLGVGSDEQLLTADSTKPSGVKWAGSIGLSDADFLSDIIYDTRYFSSAGLLPGTLYYRTPVDTPPLPDWDNTGVSTVTIGSYRRWLSVPSTQCLGWDTGALRQRLLIILTGFLPCSGDRLVFGTTVRTPGGDLVGNGYGAGLSGTGQYKLANGGWGGLTATNLYSLTNNIPYAVAVRFDNGNVRCFYRFGHAQWVEGTWFNDGTYTSLRNCGVRMYGGGSLYLGPVCIYYDT